jgi:hypothetical protein
MGIALQKEKMGRVRVTNLHPADVASQGYDIDDNVETILAKTDGKMIPLQELVGLIIFLLQLEASVVHQIDVKPLNQEIGMTFLA